MAAINTVDQQLINARRKDKLVDSVTVPNRNVDRVIELHPRIEPETATQQVGAVQNGRTAENAQTLGTGYDYLMSAYPNAGASGNAQRNPFQTHNPYTKPNYDTSIGNGGATAYPSYSEENSGNETAQQASPAGSYVGGPTVQNGQNYLSNLGNWFSNLLSNSQTGSDTGVGSGDLNLGGSSVLSSLFGNSGGYSNYLSQMYDELLNAQLAQLETSYQQNVSDLDASRAETDNAYAEQKRQTMGTAERDAAAWREIANAQGLNSGAVGQAALAMNNQRQSNLNALERDQAAAIAEIERQRILLGQQYQQQISSAIAESNFEKANALYQEAIRLDEQTNSLKSSLSGNMATVYRSSSAASGTDDDTKTKKDKDKTDKSSGSGSADSDQGVSKDAAFQILVDRIENGGHSAEEQEKLITRYYEMGLITDEQMYAAFKKIKIQSSEELATGVSLNKPLLM